MIKVNFNQKKTESMGAQTRRGLAATGTSQIYSQISEVLKESNISLDTKAVVKVVMNFILALSLPVGLKIYEMKEIGKLENQKTQEQSVLTQKNQELANLNKQLEDYAYLKDLANEFQSKRDFLRSISEDRLIVPRVIDFIQTQIPKDVWLSTLQISLQKDKKDISISGFSFKEASINYFTHSLQEILYGESISVDTKDVKESQSESILKTSFNLKGELK